MLIFTDFFFSKDTEKSDRKKYSDSRLIFSFDSSAWFFIYHFGFALPKPDTLNSVALPNPETLNPLALPKPETLNPKPQAQSPKP